MEIQQLEYFLVISEAGSFTRAAESLYISKPTITKSMRDLEREVGFPLFDSRHKLTPDGEIFARHVAKVLAGIRSTVPGINALKSFSAGTLSLGIDALTASRAGTRLIADFHQQYPDVHIYMTTDMSAVLEHDLAEHRVDLAIVSQPISTPSLDAVPLSSEELVVCCNYHHPLHRRNLVTIDDIASEHLVTLPAGSYYYSLIESAYAAAGHQLHTIMETDEVAVLHSLVAAGCGISILPRSLCERDDALVTLKLEPELHLELYLAWRRDLQLPDIAEAFRQLAVSPQKQ